MGMRNHGFEPGPLSDYEHAIKDFHDRIRACARWSRCRQHRPRARCGARNAAMLAG